MRGSPTDAAREIFSGIAGSYDGVAAVLSLGQDPRWRRALVGMIDADPHDLVLDVATGTGLVAAEVSRRYGCRVVGLDRSADMLAAARRRGLVLVHGRAEALPFPDQAFDHVAFTYLLRYVDDPAATLRELARVLRPGGRLVALDFGVPSGPLWSPLWRLYVGLVLPLAGRLVSRRWGAVGAFLGPSIRAFHGRYPQPVLERFWREAGLERVRVRRMSLGGGVVMAATKGAAIETRAEETRGAPAFYALRPGGWRDYWTLLHPPYTAWHLSYVLMGASLGASPDPRIVAGALLAFALAVGVAAHSFDELHGRPLGTQIPSGVLIALGALGLIGALAVGLAGVVVLGPGLAPFVIAGAALVLLYSLEAPLVHSDVGFAVAWGSFPVVATAYAVGAQPIPTAVVALAAAVLSLAQRRLSTRVRQIRRRARSVDGEVRYRDGTREALDAMALIAAPEGALRLLWVAALGIGAGMLLVRWL